MAWLSELCQPSMLHPEIEEDIFVRPKEKLLASSGIQDFLLFLDFVITVRIPISQWSS